MRSIRRARKAVMAFGTGLLLPTLAGATIAPQPLTTAVSRAPEVAQACPQPEEDVRQAQICFNPATRLVTITMPERDAHGYPIPPLGRDSFAVYEDGVRQHNVDVEIQRAPLTLGILVEHGGRYHTLDETINDAVSQASSALIDEMLPDDRTAVWAYGDKLVQVSGFSSGPLALQQALDKVSSTVPVSESNLYDALDDALARMSEMQGRKALLLISSGVDTFSKTSYREVLEDARTSGVPIYVINLNGILQQDPTLTLNSPPYSRLNWRQARIALTEVARLSGGRVYTPDFEVDFHSIYDDLLQKLRARYVLSYHSSSALPAGSPRSVRVVLLNSSGAPLLAGGKGRHRETLMVVDTYVPRFATASRVATLAATKQQGCCDPVRTRAAMAERGRLAKDPL